MNNETNDVRFSFEVEGEYAMFTTPESKSSGEKTSYPVPTYEALKGMVESVYWKPTIDVVIDRVRIMNPINYQAVGVTPRNYEVKQEEGKTAVVRDLNVNSRLVKPRYQIEFHYVWSNNPEYEKDRDYSKHNAQFYKHIEHGGRRDVYLGTRDCQATIIPCVFGDGNGYYDNIDTFPLDIMYHSITYPDHAYNEKTQNRITVNFDNIEMKNGIIEFNKPQDTEFQIYHKELKTAKTKNTTNNKRGKNK